MKKFILPILLFLMFIPFYANAETIANNKYYKTERKQININLIVSYIGYY